MNLSTIARVRHIYFVWQCHCLDSDQCG